MQVVVSGHRSGRFDALQGLNEVTISALALNVKDMKSLPLFAKEVSGITTFTSITLHLSSEELASLVGMISSSDYSVK